jgi:hypothetical protein
LTQQSKIQFERELQRMIVEIGKDEQIDGETAALVDLKIL